MHQKPEHKRDLPTGAALVLPAPLQAAADCYDDAAQYNTVNLWMDLPFA